LPTLLPVVASFQPGDSEAAERPGKGADAAGDLL
jgi:hypothetical protein